MKLRKFFDGIAFRISLSIAAVVAASTIAVGWLILQEERKTLEAELQGKGTYLAELMSHQVVEPLLYEERYAILSLLQGAMKSAQSLIVNAEVYDKKGEVIVSVYKDKKYSRIIRPQYAFDHPAPGVYIQEDNSLPLYHMSMPVNAGNLGTIGFLRLCITKEYLLSTLKDVKKKLFLFSTAVTFIGIILGLSMARKVLQPVLILSKGVSLVGEGEVGVEVPVVGHGEIKDLSKSFNRMSVKLKDLIDKIKSAQEHMVRTEKLYALGEFSAGIAHEIKNPLTPIMMLVNKVKRHKKSLTDEDIDIIEKEIKRIDKIVREFLAFARPEKTEKTNVDVNEVLEDIITITMPKMEQSAIHLVKNLGPSLPPIKGNHDALKQAFLNLILNAIQAMDGWSGRLSIKSEAKDRCVSVSITDTGSGISPENLKRIFDPFFTTKAEGTGMGLMLVHSIISDHSGKIDIDSAPGKGTTVKVEFPSPLAGEG
ncbi:MAG: HAMP domain-containing protein [Nitrospirae bacterium]|nr:HAMP domain-containing protein [Nitrospirota bacterium]